MDHYSKCNICGEMVKNMRQHEKHKHRGNQKASVVVMLIHGIGKCKTPFQQRTQLRLQVKCVICNSWLNTKKEVRNVLIHHWNDLSSNVGAAQEINLK